MMTMDNPKLASCLLSSLSYVLLINTASICVVNGAGIKLEQPSPQGQDIHSVEPHIYKPIPSNLDDIVASVIVQRHCVRSSTTYPPDVWGPMPANYTKNLADYTAHVWPDAYAWGVEAGACTQEGKELVVALGSAYIDVHPQPFHFVVDVNSGRDNTTADMLIQGSYTLWKCKVDANLLLCRNK
ncbi:hypothetical protein SARC_11285 [Sphaeroforma arctica JP610]|uniref:Uncharacterized protein n=1 Tax=Sphaeroforma arctica JP610 TaxID=667725 RepID=A0A0L0FIB7_9EUKA|nr:hypothetical protein SARC_11285 [Sphaeroforma arctica JP610]KNC76206.1 hypothetical protein SARC_11285 [Sphaeroforma arctica JP610]|eukprot:XP_014150108.1 hypothetical protein SARC_11285 [Sphaeroforma arctica JP610]